MVHCQKRVTLPSNMANITALLCLVLALTSSCLCCEDSCPGPVQANVRAIQRQTQLLSQQLEKLVAEANRLEENCDDQQNATDVARNCAEVQMAGNNADGVYTIYPGGPEGPQRSVYCDLTTDGGGWTLFQRRMDGSVDFFRDLGPYKRGFGRPSSEHWLGLNNIRLLVQQGPQELRVDLEAFDGATAYAEYSEFYIDGAQDGYKLHVTGYSGTAGDSLAIHADKPFATRDHDSPDNCAVTYHGAWWYQSCHHSNLNGQYFEGGSHSSYANGVNWSGWKGYNYSMKRTEMKIRPAGFPPST